MNELDAISLFLSIALNVPPGFWGYLLQCIFDSIRKWFSRKKEPGKYPEFTCNEAHIEKRREISFEWGSLRGSYKSHTVNNKRATACLPPSDSSSVNESQEHNMRK